MARLQDRYKVNIQTLISFLNTSNEQVKVETKNAVLFKLAITNIKYLDMHLTKSTHKMHEENSQTLMEEIEKLSREIVHVHGYKESVLSRCLFFST